MQALRLMQSSLAALFLLASPSLSAQEAPPIEVSVQADVPVRGTWGSRAVEVDFYLAQDLVGRLQKSFPHRPFVAVKTLSNEVRYSLQFRLWAENWKKERCQDASSEECTFWSEVILSASSFFSPSSDKIEVNWRLEWCRVAKTAPECGRKVDVGVGDAKKIYPDAFAALLRAEGTSLGIHGKDSFEEALLKKVPIAETSSPRLYKDQDGLELLLAVLPLRWEAPYTRRLREQILEGEDEPLRFEMICSSRTSDARLLLRGDAYTDAISYDTQSPSTSYEAFAVDLAQVKRGNKKPEFVRPAKAIKELEKFPSSLVLLFRETERKQWKISGAGE
jgi:hypothetical protein